MAPLARTPDPSGLSPKRARHHPRAVDVARGRNLRYGGQLYVRRLWSVRREAIRIRQATIKYQQGRALTLLPRSRILTRTHKMTLLVSGSAFAADFESVSGSNKTMVRSHVGL